MQENCFRSTFFPGSGAEGAGKVLGFDPQNPEILVNRGDFEILKIFKNTFLMTFYIDNIFCSRRIFINIFPFFTTAKPFESAEFQLFNCF